MSRFLVPSLDRGGLSLYGLAGGPEYYLDADNSRCGTTGARTFDGEQYVELTSAIDPGTSDFWLSFWGYGEKANTVIATGATGDVVAGFRLRWFQNKMQVSICDSQVGATRLYGYVTDDAVSSGWVHVVVCFDRSGDATCYLNGVLQTATLNIAAANGVLGSSFLPTIGSYNGVFQFLDGDLSKIAYGTGLLTTDEIAELYNSGNGITRAMYSAGLAAKTVHSWNCNEAPESTLYDSTGSNHGTPSLPGTELVTNGGFDSDLTGWTLANEGGSTGWRHNGSGAAEMHADAATSYRNIYQDILTIGRTYRYSIDINAVSDNVVLYNGGTIVAEFTTTGTKTGVFVATNTLFYVYCGTDDTCTIDDVSVVRTGPHVGSTAGPEATNVTDSVGSNNGLAVNMDVSNVSNDIPTALAGTGVKSLSFDGVEEYVDYGNPSSLQLADNFSWCGWLKTTTSNSDTATLFGKNGTDSALKWTLYLNLGKVRCAVRSATDGYEFVDSNVNVADGNWHFAAAVYDAPNLTLYVDANTPLVESSAAGGIISPSDYDVYFARGYGNTYTNSSMCDWRVYNTPLSATEIAQLYAGTDVTDGLVSRWKFDDQWNTPPGDGDTIVAEESRAGTTTLFRQNDIEYRPTWEEDAFGSFPGIAFAGTDDYLAHSGALISDYPFVMPVLFKGETKAAQALVDISDVSEAAVNYGVGITSDGFAVARKRNGGAFATVTDDEDICDGDAHLIIAVFTSDTSMTLWVDGEEIGTATDDIAVAAGVDTITLGALGSSTMAEFLTGTLGERLLYSAAVTDAEIMDLFRRARSRYGVTLR
jgi:hypothetical protein